MTQTWGPRPGGPQPGPPAPVASGPNGCLVALLVVLGIVGLALLPFSQTRAAGAVVLLLAILVLIGMIAGRDRGQRLVQEQQEERRRASDAWRNGLVENRLAVESDPIGAMRRLHAGQGTTVPVGVTPDRREWRSVNREQAVLVLGPPRSGKTSSLIVPAVLSAPGPVVVTSTKGDVMTVTAPARSRDGRVWLFDPSGTEEVPSGVTPLHWTPLTSSATWDGARAMAAAMVDAAGGGEGTKNADHWSGSAKALLAPLLHAAALDGLTIVDVRRWSATGSTRDAGAILNLHDATVAEDDLIGLEDLGPDERGSVLSTLRRVLDVYGSQAVTERSLAQNFSPDEFVRSNDTVYITASSQQQQLIAPLVTGLLEDIRSAAYRRHRAKDGGAQQPVLWALDEVANIAPLKTLPGMLSESGGQGLQIMACFQDLSQARRRWPADADGFLTLFGTKVVFPGIGDQATLAALSVMVGDWDRPYTVYNRSTNTNLSYGVAGRGSSRGASDAWSYSAHREALLSPSEIANIPAGHALVVETGRWSLVAALPYYAAPVWQRALQLAPAEMRAEPAATAAEAEPQADPIHMDEESGHR